MLFVILFYSSTFCFDIYLGDNLRHAKVRGLCMSTRESHSLRPTETSEGIQIGLPKVDLKSPARVIREQEQSPQRESIQRQTIIRTGVEARDASSANEEIAYDRATSRNSSSTPPAFETQKRIIKGNHLRDDSLSPSPAQDLRQVSGTMTISQNVAPNRRNSSGTPVSIMSKVGIERYRIL